MPCLLLNDRIEVAISAFAFAKREVKVYSSHAAKIYNSSILIKNSLFKINPTRIVKYCIFVT